MIHLDKVSFQGFPIDLDRFSLGFHAEFQLALLGLVPLGLLSDHVVVSLTPKFTQLVKLVDLRILHFDEAVFTVPDFFTLFCLFFGAIRTATATTVMTVILANQKSIELSVAELAIWLVLLQSLSGVVSILDSRDDCRVERIYLLWRFHSHLL